MRRASGFALIMAIFIIVTLAAIGVYLLTVSTGQLEATAQDEQGARAYQAARTGLEWGAYQVLQNPAPIPFATNCLGGAATNQTLALTQGLAGFYAQVSCARIGNEVEAGNAVAVVLVTSRGCNSTPCGVLSAGYVERELVLTLAR